MRQGEFFEIAKAWFFISFAFAILFSGGVNAFADVSGFLMSFLISGFTVGLGFLFHELAHRSLARRYGIYAEFKAFNLMLFLAVAMSFFGFIFAAPGAVVMHSRFISREKNGKISLVGPLMNVILALLFLPLFLYVSFSRIAGILFLISRYGFFINTLLALFNMIPFGGFDGKKVFDWNKTAWAIISGISALLLMIVFIF